MGRPKGSNCPEATGVFSSSVSGGLGSRSGWSVMEAASNHLGDVSRKRRLGGGDFDSFYKGVPTKFV